MIRTNLRDLRALFDLIGLTWMVDRAPVWADSASPIGIWSRPTTIHLTTYARYHTARPRLFLSLSGELYYHVPGGDDCPSIHRVNLRPLTFEQLALVLRVVEQAKAAGILLAD